MQIKFLLTKNFCYKSTLLTGIFCLMMSYSAQGATPLDNFESAEVAFRNITGTVTSSDDGEPLIGVTIRVEGKSGGTITDFDGRFEIDADADDVLLFSYTGMKDKEVVVGSQSVLDVTLDPNTAILDEVVVIGYGTQKKSHLTGSVSKVENENLDQIAVARVDDALIGQVSGVNIQAFSRSWCGSYYYY